MPKKQHSALHDLLVSLRRVLVLLVTAFAIAMEWPIHVVAARVIILWATLVVVTHAAEILFQYLTQRALERQNDMISQTSRGAVSS